MNKTGPVIAGLLLLLALVLFSTTYTVRFHEVAIKSRFGKTGEQSIVREAGLHWRLPLFAERVTKLDTRLQLIESPLIELPTADQQQIVVRAYLLWRARTDGLGPLEFYERFRGEISSAESYLSEQFRSALPAISRFTFDDLVGEGSAHQQAEQAVLQTLAGATRGLGIEPVSVGFSQLLLPARTSVAVLGRMKSARQSLAENERSAGTAEASRIESQARSMADKIRTFAEARAEEIRNQGNLKAAEYLRQMAVAEEFAIFLVQVDALRRSLSKYTTVLLPFSVAPFHLMNPQAPLSAGGVPLQPEEIERARRPLPPGSLATPAVPAPVDDQGS